MVSFPLYFGDGTNVFLYIRVVTKTTKSRLVTYGFVKGKFDGLKISSKLYLGVSKTTSNPLILMLYRVVQKLLLPS